MVRLRGCFQRSSEQWYFRVLHSKYLIAFCINVKDTHYEIATEMETTITNSIFWRLREIPVIWDNNKSQNVFMHISIMTEITGVGVDGGVTIVRRISLNNIAVM